MLGLTTDVKGTMLAVQSDRDVYVYQSSDSSPIDRRQNIMGNGSRAGQKIALGDINGDGRIDLVTVSDQRRQRVLRPSGGGLLRQHDERQADRSARRQRANSTDRGGHGC